LPTTAYTVIYNETVSDFFAAAKLVKYKKSLASATNVLRKCKFGAGYPAGAVLHYWGLGALHLAGRLLLDRYHTAAKVCK
jgi:hypothetical protein